MKNQLIYLLIAIFCLSCGNPERTAEQTDDALTVSQEEIPVVAEESTPNKLEVLEDTIFHKREIGKSILTSAKVLSVSEVLIMPSDYLTTAMTVETVTNDILVFLDMDGFENLVNQVIPIQYKVTTGVKLLVCFDCSSYSEKIHLYDMTSFPSDLEFENLKLKEYVQDPYIDPASTFIMVKEDGSIEEFYSNNNDLIADSIKMAAAFHTYGIITKLHPELENREELELLVK